MRKFQIFEKVIPATEPEDICQVVIMIIIPLEGPYMLRGKGQDDSWQVSIMIIGHVIAGPNMLKFVIAGGNGVSIMIMLPGKGQEDISQVSIVINVDVEGQNMLPDIGKEERSPPNHVY